VTAVDKRLLLKPRLDEATITVPGVGEVRVRALSRADILNIQGAEARGTLEFERVFLSAAMVDPKLTPEEVGEWQKAAGPDEMEDVIVKVRELSGLDKGAAKRAYKEFESHPDAEFRVPAGSEAGDDGGPAAGGDAAG